MYAQHANFVSPSDDVVIWRYMSLEKLLAMLSSSTLYLARLDTFKDPWEGVWPDALRDALMRGQPSDVAAKVVAMATSITRSHFVNCWHQSQHESAALWEQYGGSAGFAIRSTVRDLKEALVEAPTFFLGVVEYIDYQEQPRTEKGVLDGMSHRLYPMFLKRKSFEHEREVRVLALDTSMENDATISVAYRVNLARLINALYIAPTSPEWLVPTIASVLSAFSLSQVPVIRSSLYDAKID